MNSDHKYTNKNTLYKYYFKRPQIPNFVPYEFTLHKHLMISIGKLRTQQGTGSREQQGTPTPHAAFVVAADVRGHRINIQSVRRRKTQNLALIAVVTAQLQTTIKTLLNTHKLRHVVAF